MTPEVYGHPRGLHSRRIIRCHSKVRVGAKVSGGYSRFVTEIIELVINFGYVRVLAKKRVGASQVHCTGFFR